MTRLTVDPPVMMAKGNTMLGQASDFEKKINDVYNIVGQMLAKDYISPEATALGNSIQVYKPKLANVPKIIQAYGEYCIWVAKDTTARQENGVSSVKPMN